MVETFLKTYCGCNDTRGWMESFEKVSKDKKEHMSSSQRNVINFDKVSKSHNKIRKYGERLASNDALYVTDEGEFYFIEFKNGALCKSIKNKEKDEGKEENLKSKVYCSLAMALDLKLAESFDSFKQQYRYILVYNKDKLGTLSNICIEEEILEHAGFSVTLPIVKEFAWLFKDVISYTKEEFEREFIQKIVEPEYQTASS